jgi:hypothetical protein
MFMNRAVKYACNYAVLRFLPYPETGEFVNLGVVVHCPARRYFDMQVETRKQARVTDFFPELDRESFRAARAAIAAEMERVKMMIRHRDEPDQGRVLFRELVRPREAVFRFGEIRTILTDKLETLAPLLFAQYVNRHFAQPKEYQETVMARRFYDALRTFRPDRVFHRDQLVGTEEYHVRIPICSDWCTPDGVPMRAIKPLDLIRNDPTAVIEHGDAWIQRVRRLRAIDRLPERFIFATRRPKDSAGSKAARKVLTELEGEGVTLVEAEATEQILKLAAD